MNKKYDEAKKCIKQYVDANEQLLEQIATIKENHYDLVEGWFDTLQELIDNYKTLLNEFCFHCGKYKTEHLGSCNGCKWKEERNG